ncbi:MAG: iron permease, partial [Sphingobium sp. 32-64-5]
MKLMAIFWQSFAALMFLAVSFPATAQTPDSAVQTTWQLLDYIAVDYPGAVEDGRIISEVEYSEMQEFSIAVDDRLRGLPDRPERAALIADAQNLQRAITNKASASDVGKQAHTLARRLLAAYPVPLAPRSPPDLSRAKTLYASNCGSCHGASGDGKGPQAAGLNPPPIAFRDSERARQRSIFGIYQVLANGVEGTAMQSFADLPAQDRWSLAFYTGSFAFTDVEQGKNIWETSGDLHRRFPDMAALTSITPLDLAAEIGPEKAYALTAYLRSNPDVLVQPETNSLSIARSKLQSSLTAYRAGKTEQARELALSAYLDGFEPLEAVLATRDSKLLIEIEQ